jgi:hypothetical protein
MAEQNFKLAGWAAVAAVIAFVAEIALNLASGLPGYSGVASSSVATIVFAIHVAFGSYATWRLRAFLIEKYDFHGVDSLIPLLVGAGILFALAQIGSGFVSQPGLSNALLLGPGALLGTLSVLFGYRLIGVNGRMGGYKMPFACCHIGAPICFLTVVLAPVGLVLLVVAAVLLALIFFNDESPELEFV